MEIQKEYNLLVHQIYELPISETPSHLLSWSHYVELLKISYELELSFLS